MRRAAEMALLLCVAPTVTTVADNQEALEISCSEAFAREDYDTAIAPCAELAERGDAEAQFRLGWMYDEGDAEFPEDNLKAVRWYATAAKQGHAESQYSLGWMYDEGEGVPEDDAIAVEWYRLAAEQGHAEAQNSLGWMYDNGVGVKENDTEAAEWYTRAAEQGILDAKRNLILLSRDVPDDRVDNAEIVKWFTLRASAPRHTCIVVETTAEQRQEIQESYKAEAIAEKARAEAGHAESQLKIGIKYLRGEGISKNSTKAFEWLSKAAEQGYPEAQFLVGTLYATGKGAPRNDVKAFMWLNLAAAPLRFKPPAEGKELLRDRMTRKQIAKAQRLSTEWFEGFTSTEFFGRLTSTEWFDRFTGQIHSH